MPSKSIWNQLSSSFHITRWLDEIGSLISISKRTESNKSKQLERSSSRLGGSNRNQTRLKLITKAWIRASKWSVRDKLNRIPCSTSRQWMTYLPSRKIRTQRNPRCSDQERKTMDSSFLPSIKTSPSSRKEKTRCFRSELRSLWVVHHIQGKRINLSTKQPTNWLLQKEIMKTIMHMKLSISRSILEKHSNKLVKQINRFQR